MSPSLLTLYLKFLYIDNNDIKEILNFENKKDIFIHICIVHVILDLKHSLRTNNHRLFIIYLDMIIGDQCMELILEGN